MKKSIKILFTISLTLIAIGLILCGILIPSMLKNGDAYRKKIDAMLNGGSFVELPSEEMNLDGVQTIIFNQADQLDVKVQPSNQPNLSGKFYCYEDNVKDSKMYFERQGETLYIRLNYQQRGQYLFGASPRAQQVVIDMPRSFKGNVVLDGMNSMMKVENLALQSLTINGNEDATFDLDRISCERLISKGNYSVYSMRNMNVDVFEATGEQSSGYFWGKANHLNLSIAEGNCGINLEDYAQEMTISATNASVDLKMPKHIAKGFNLMVNLEEAELAYGMNNPDNPVRYGEGQYMLTYGMGEYRYQVNMQRGTLSVY